MAGQTCRQKSIDEIGVIRKKIYNISRKITLCGVPDYKQYIEYRENLEKYLINLRDVPSCPDENGKDDFVVSGARKDAIIYGTKVIRNLNECCTLEEQFVPCLPEEEFGSCHSEELGPCTPEEKFTPCGGLINSCNCK